MSVSDKFGRRETDPVFLTFFSCGHLVLDNGAPYLLLTSGHSYCSSSELLLQLYLLVQMLGIYRSHPLFT